MENKEASKLKRERPPNPAVLLREYTQRKWELDLGGRLPSHVHCRSIHNGQDTETTEVSVDGWMDEEDMVYMYNGT